MNQAMQKYSNRADLIAEVKKYFDIDELVCPHTFKRFGEQAWQFFDSEILATILVVRRDILKAPMYCNGPNYTQRGNRCNCCSMIKAKTTNYMSAHILCKAFDFDVKNMTAAQARKAIVANSHLLPANIRLEDGVTWLHIDTMAYDKKDKVTLFKV